MKIRLAREADHDRVWNIFHEVVAAGDTYALDPHMSRREALAYWFAPSTHTYVVEVGSQSVATEAASGAARANRVIAGTYILRANQAGGGSHVANAAFMLPASVRGQGIGRAMAQHCLSEARRLGFRAMQFNFVISTNTAAIRLWQELVSGPSGLYLARFVIRKTDMWTFM